MMKFIVFTCVAAFVGGQRIIIVEDEPAPVRQPVQISIINDDVTPIASPAAVVVEEEDDDDDEPEGITLSIKSDVETPVVEQVVPQNGPVLAEVEPIKVNAKMLERIVDAFVSAGVEEEAQSFLDALKLSNLAGLVTSKIAKNKDSGLIIFVPNNDAFAEAINALGLTPSALADNKPLLDTILLYHIIDTPPVDSTVFIGVQTEVTTIAPGQDPLLVTGDDTGVFVTDQTGESATVVTADVTFRNLVFHIIDKVLVPELPAV
eukprot:TRINITY_DN5276_c0_g2_i1.p1 TRINITY_DN5276_c0_g2~~TRINITY_DN5276_c0_g2_i1.p1  ORF type:complete len:262 (-),score=77.22 TRINITY_DN5276_c0_g2_i1:259-1044(-)